jgi:hypothetical protein
MGTDIVDMTLNELMDVKKVFRKLDASNIANLLSKGGVPMCLVCGLWSLAVSVSAQIPEP